MGSPELPLWKKCLLELFGTSAISFFGPATIVVGFLVPWLDDVSRLFFDALVPGITLAICIATIAKYTGSHVNPAITITFTFTSRVSFRPGLVAPYFLSQVLGGLLGGFALRAIFDSIVPSASLGSNKLGVGVSPVEGIVLEIIGTMALCLVVLAVVAFVPGAGKQGAIAGAALSVLIFVLGPVSGGSLNPVRSLGPALFAGYLEGQYVYLIGPPVGAALAGLLFRALRRSPR